MRRSKLERYVDILQVLAHMGPLKLTHIMCKSNFNGSVIKEYLGFLIKRGLVEERIVKKNRTVFAVTQRGINVLKYFRELMQVLPVVEDFLPFGITNNEALTLLNQQEEIKSKISKSTPYSVQTEPTLSFKNTTSSLQPFLDRLLGEDIEVERKSERKKAQLIA